MRRSGPGYLEVIAHEIGHSLGGYPEGAPDFYFHHAKQGSDLCAAGDETDHLMCESGTTGWALDALTCAHWHATIESKHGPRNYTEICDDVDNDLDGEADEDLACP
ncbi:MAG: hypothetical protein R3F60_27485 [bacterium]